MNGYSDRDFFKESEDKAHDRTLIIEMVSSRLEGLTMALKALEERCVFDKCDCRGHRDAIKKLMNETKNLLELEKTNCTI